MLYRRFREMWKSVWFLFVLGFLIAFFVVVNSGLWWVNSQGESTVPLKGELSKTGTNVGRKRARFTPRPRGGWPVHGRLLSRSQTQRLSRRGPVSGAGRAAALLVQPACQVVLWASASKGRKGRGAGGPGSQAPETGTWWATKGQEQLPSPTPARNGI